MLALHFLKLQFYSYIFFSLVIAFVLVPVKFALGLTKLLGTRLGMDKDVLETRFRSLELKKKFQRKDLH